MEICRLILANVNDKNPVNHDGETPSQLAAYHGHLPVMELIKSALSKRGLIKIVPTMMATQVPGSGPATPTTSGGRRSVAQSSTTPATPVTTGNAAILVESTPGPTESLSSSSSESSDSNSDSAGKISSYHRTLLY